MIAPRTTQRALTIVGAIVLSIGAGLSAGAQSITPGLENTDAFEIAFGMSFLVFDACGDSATGELQRRALLDKFERCPFSAEARKRLHQRAGDLRAKANEELRRYVAEHGRLPDRLEGMKEKETCQDLLQRPDYVKHRDLLVGYSKGEVSLDAVMPERCDVGAAPP